MYINRKTWFNNYSMLYVGVIPFIIGLLGLLITNTSSLERRQIWVLCFTIIIGITIFLSISKLKNNKNYRDTFW